MFYFDNFFGKKILKSSILSDIDCFFTTREFVLTYSSREDLKEVSEKNRIFLLDKLNSKKLVTAKQIHSSNIETVKDGVFFYDNTDALISNIKDTVLLLNFADCIPIILYSKQNKTGALIHAGWRGSASEIAKKTVLKMTNDLNIKTKTITALIGPGIGKCCFETDADVFEKLISDKSNKNLYEKKGNKYFIDLKLLNANQLSECGIENIDICNYCTCCMSDIFFSYRKENGITARHSAVIKI